MKQVLYIFIGLLCTVVFSQDNTAFNEGNSLYNNGKYNEAIEKYEQLLDSKKQSAELFFNLANAHYKSNNVAECIYYYEKALQLKPGDKDILNNLNNYAHNMRIDAIEIIPKVGFNRIINKLITSLSTTAWATLAIVGIMLFSLLFLWYHFSYVTQQKRIAFIICSLGLFLACFAFIMAFQRNHLDQKDNPAIVFTQEARVKSEANKSSEEILRLHEGTKVQVLNQYEGWYKIELTNHTIGWMRSEDIKLLKSF